MGIYGQFIIIKYGHFRAVGGKKTDPCLTKVFQGSKMHFKVHSTMVIEPLDQTAYLPISLFLAFPGTSQRGEVHYGRGPISAQESTWM